MMSRIDPADRSHWPLQPWEIHPHDPTRDAKAIVRMLGRWTIRPPFPGEKNRSRVITKWRQIRLKRSLWNAVERVRLGKATRADAICVAECLGHEIVHVKQKSAWRLRFEGRWAIQRVPVEGQAFAFQACAVEAYGIGVGGWAKRFLSRRWWWAKYGVALRRRKERREAYEAIMHAARDGRARRKEVMR